MPSTKEFLKKENIFAVAGVSRNKEKYGFKVYDTLKKAGYKIYPINPTASEIDGEKCYPSLEELPEKPDVVITVVPPKVTDKIAEKCKELNINKIWMQPGSESKKSIDFCKKNNIEVIHSACIMIEQIH